MEQNLHTLLASPLYINEMYGVSLIPTAIKIFNNKESSTDNREKRIASLQSSVENSGISSTANKVVIVDFIQPVVKFDVYPYWMGTKTYTKILKQLEADESVAGVVLNIDSGGGQVYGTPEFYDFIKNYSKPIVAYTDGYMCSGAYYIAGATQKIIANKRADAIGSIGAYATIIDGNGIIEHFGGKVHTLYATHSTDKNSEYRAVIDNADYEPYIKNQLDPIVETFVSDMKVMRPQLKEEVFNGGTWTGEQALSLGLIDEHGTLDTAVQSVFNLSQNSNSKSNHMNTKSLPKVEATLGLDAPLALNENGSYLNVEQLDALETRLDSLESEKANLEEQLATSNTSKENAVNAITAQLTEVKNNAQKVESSVDAILTKAGMSTEGTLAEKLSALETKAEAYGKGDGARGTTPRIDANGEQNSSMIIGGVDVSEALNN
ncbi:S49 family peptidase [Flavobacterium davisii]|uniref:S49 family peptidase n=1 Tax=Flavobacterium davisii TaxID=2906077 RepID=A0ABW8PQJ3_9FLAO